MDRYTNVKVNISDGQKKKLKKALAARCELSIRLSNDDLEGGNDMIAVTQSQLNKLNKAYQSGTGIVIKMSKSQVAYNRKIEGGFLSLLAGLAAKALPFIASTIAPALGIGALSGVGSVIGNKVAKKVVGDGLYLKKGGYVCRVETDGKNALFEPVHGKALSSFPGDGLYLKQKGQVFDGRGLLLGPNSPFKNIPILGLLL